MKQKMEHYKNCVLDERVWFTNGQKFSTEIALEVAILVLRELHQEFGLDTDLLINDFEFAFNRRNIAEDEAQITVHMAPGAAIIDQHLKLSAKIPHWIEGKQRKLVQERLKQFENFTVVSFHNFEHEHKDGLLALGYEVRWAA